MKHNRHNRRNLHTSDARYGPGKFDPRKVADPSYSLCNSLTASSNQVSQEVSFCFILSHSVSGQIKQFSSNQRLIEFFKEEPTLQLQLHTVLLWASVCLLCYCYGPNHVTLSNLDSCLDVCSSMVSVSVILTA